MSSLAAISLNPPWGSLMAFGFKRYETRSWAPRKRLLAPGQWLAIHQTLNFPKDVIDFVKDDDQDGAIFRKALTHVGYERLGDLPRGKVVCLLRFQGVVETETLPGLSDLPEPGTWERAFGDYRPGRYVWKFDKVIEFDEPIEAKGSRLIWQWEHPDWIPRVISYAESQHGETFFITCTPLGAEMRHTVSINFNAFKGANLAYPEGLDQYPVGFDGEGVTNLKTFESDSHESDSQS